MEQPINIKTDEEIKQRTENPLVFISHDTKDAEIAEAFSRLLRSVSAGMLKSFRSSDNSSTQGIEFGTEWYPKIVEKLHSASDVVCIITDLSIDRPWILFEAGIAKSRLNIPILGVAIGVPLAMASTGPFALFQNCSDDISSLTKLVNQLVKKLPNSEPDEEVIRQQVDSFLLKTQDILNGRKEAEINTNLISRDDSNGPARLFEEVKIMFKELPNRIENISKTRNNNYDKKIYSGMYEELLLSSLKYINLRAGLQIALAPIRNDYPWLYESGMDTANAMMNSKNIEETESAVKSFIQLLDFTANHPLMENLLEDTSFYRYVKHLSIMIERYFQGWISDSPNLLNKNYHTND